MKVYLTGVDTIKSPKRVYNNEIKKENKREQNLNDETNGIREESVSKEKYDEEQNFPKHHKIKRKAKDFNKIEVKKKTNNFISLDDIKTSKNKNHFYNVLEFEKLRRHQIENQKNSNKNFLEMAKHRDKKNPTARFGGGYSNDNGNGKIFMFEGDNEDE